MEAPPKNSVRGRRLGDIGVKLLAKDPPSGKGDAEEDTERARDNNDHEGLADSGVECAEGRT